MFKLYFAGRGYEIEEGCDFEYYDPELFFVDASGTIFSYDSANVYVTFNERTENKVNCHVDKIEYLNSIDYKSLKKAELIEYAKDYIDVKSSMTKSEIITLLDEYFNK